MSLLAYLIYFSQPCLPKPFCFLKPLLALLTNEDLQYFDFGQKIIISDVQRQFNCPEEGITPNLHQSTVTQKYV